MEFDQRISSLITLYKKHGHDYLLLVAHSTLFLSKLPTPKKIKDTNLLVIKGIIESYEGVFHNSLQEKFVTSLQSGKSILENYLDWEQTEIIEKNLPMAPPLALVRFSYQPWYKYYISFSFHKKEERMKITMKMYEDMQDYNKDFILSKLSK